MLDKTKLIKEFNKRSKLLFPDHSSKKSLAHQIWDNISNDPLFSQRAIAAQSSFLIPGWNGNLNDMFEVRNDIKEYSVLSTDGSQVYPDRNMPGSSCFLINVGGCYFNYGEKSSVKFISKPMLMVPDDLALENFSKELVDLKREELELEYAINLAKEFKTNTCLFDGSLIFWHLESKSPEVKEKFLDVYLDYLNEFYQNKVLIAGYISLPKSRELVNLIKLGLCRFKVADCIGCHREYDTFPCKEVDSLIDTQIINFLKPYHRTTIFWSNSKITSLYPSHLKPHFFYFNVGDEIARIEIPAWVAQNDEYVDHVCKVILDQSMKGQGYPICIAEAHEQAVVKGADREFFYHLVLKVGVENNKKFFVSQKSIKKRGMGI